MIGTSRFASRQTKFIPVSQFTGVDNVPLFTLTKGASAAEDPVKPSVDANDFTLNVSTLSATRTSKNVVGARRSFGTGTNPLAHPNACGMAVLGPMSATHFVVHMMELPSHWDREHDIGVRVAWLASIALTTKVILWTVAQNSFIPGTDTLDAYPTTALDTVIASDSAEGNKVISLTPQGIINGKTFGDTVKFISFKVTLTSFDVTSPYLVGLELEYTPKVGRWSRKSSQGRPWRA